MVVFGLRERVGQQVKVPKIRIREQEDLPCGSNAPSVVVEKGFEYISFKAIQRVSCDDSLKIRSFLERYTFVIDSYNIFIV
ncbi:hypothetical protein Hanom_Chr12g01164361 [Helianthus anomalus]